MRQSIIKYLNDLEEQENIKILLACESGSRAWGFSSPDSDYDIRFIYKRNLDFYLKLFTSKDTLEFNTKNDFDGSGWDLNKSLILLQKSNPPLIEWINSPILYKVDNEFLEKIKQLSEICFSPISTMHHYHSMSKNFIDKIADENVKLKHLFYTLRSSLAANWIIKTNSFPSVEFIQLLEIVPTDIKIIIQELLLIKSVNNESYLHLNNYKLYDFILQTIDFNEKNSSQLKSNIKITEKLNNFFKNEIKKE